MTDQPHPWVSLSSGELSAQIDPRGAQLSVLKDSGGRDLLWNGDPAIWAGRAPLLFPIVGTLAGGQYRLGSKTYRMGRHGFARGSVFAVANATSSTAVLSLSADDDTLRIYPFRFALDVHFEVIGPTLSITARIHNQDDADMAASFGFHPALRWPLPFGRPRSSHFIEFEADEPAGIRRIDSAGLLTPTRHSTPIVRRRLALADALFQDDVVIFDRLVSRHVVYGAGDGPRIRVSLADAPYFGVWTKPGANFICLEPWHGITDPEGYSGDFAHKPGVFPIASGGARAVTMAITLIED
jgi:galactose mutarotase-like enzyme